MLTHTFLGQLCPALNSGHVPADMKCVAALPGMTLRLDREPLPLSAAYNDVISVLVTFQFVILIDTQHYWMLCWHLNKLSEKGKKKRMSFFKYVSYIASAITIAT